MKRWLAGIPLLVFGTWAGASMFAGSEARKTYLSLLESAGEKVPFSFINEEYESGLLSSHAVTHIRASDDPDADILFSLRHDISHSLVGADGVGRVVIETRLEQETLPEKAQAFLEAFDDDEPFLVTTTRGVAGKINNVIDISGLTLEEGADRVRFDGGQLTMNVKGREVDGFGKLGQLHVVSEQGSLRAEGFDLTADFVRLGDMLFAGDTSMILGELVFESTLLPDPAVIGNLRLNGRAEEKGGTYETALSVLADELDVPVELDRIRFDSEVSGLSTLAFRQYVKTVRSLKFGGEYGTDALDEEQLQELIGAYKAMFVPGARVSYDIGMSNAGGDIDAEVSLKVREGNSPGYLDQLQTLGDLVAALKLDIEFDADAGALERTPLAMLLMSPMAEDYLVEEGIGYVSRIYTEGQVLNVNGKAILMADLVGGLLGKPLASFSLP